MMSICQSKASVWGEHKLEWFSTLDGGGYWVCMNSNCAEAVPESTGHHGG